MPNLRDEWVVEVLIAGIVIGGCAIGLIWWITL